MKINVALRGASTGKRSCFYVVKTLHECDDFCTLKNQLLSSQLRSYQSPSLNLYAQKTNVHELS